MNHLGEQEDKESITHNTFALFSFIILKFFIYLEWFVSFYAVSSWNFQLTICHESLSEKLPIMELIGIVWLNSKNKWSTVIHTHTHTFYNVELLYCIA